MKLISKKDERLYEISKDISVKDIEGKEELILSLTELMDVNNGLGIAAPQVGINESLFLLRNRGVTKVCINPEITDKSVNEILMDEGCISFVGLFMKVKRHVWIDVSYLNQEGEKIEERLSGIESQCFQHELDHLLGITFDQRVSQFVYRRAVEKRDKHVKRLMRRLK